MIHYINFFLISMHNSSYRTKILRTQIIIGQSCSHQFQFLYHLSLFKWHTRKKWHIKKNFVALNFFYLVQFCHFCPKHFCPIRYFKTISNFIQMSTKLSKMNQLEQDTIASNMAWSECLVRYMTFICCCNWSHGCLTLKYTFLNKQSPLH